MDLQITIPENLSEKATLGGIHTCTPSCFYHVSEITHSGSPLIPWHQAQADAKLKRITTDAMNRIADIALTRTRLHKGASITISAQEQKNIYGSDMYSARVKAIRELHLTQVRRGYKFPEMKHGVVSQCRLTPIQLKHTLDRVDHHSKSHDPPCS